MKERLIFVCVLVLLALPLISAEDFAEGQITVVFYGNATQENISELVSSYNLTWQRESDENITNYTRGTVFVPNGTEEYWAGIFRNESIVQGAQLNYLLRIPEETGCASEGEMCGGIAGFACCSGLKCELDGGYPDAAGICVVFADDSICDNVCGDGICQEIVCEGEGCPCAETAESCAEDCVSSDGEEQISFNWIIFIVLAIIFIIIGLKILKWIFWTLAILAVALAIWIYVF